MSESDKTMLKTTLAIILTALAWGAALIAWATLFFVPVA